MVQPEKQLWALPHSEFLSCFQRATAETRPTSYCSEKSEPEAKGVTVAKARWWRAARDWDTDSATRRLRSRGAAVARGTLRLQSESGSLSQISQPPL